MQIPQSKEIDTCSKRPSSVKSTNQLTDQSGRVRRVNKRRPEGNLLTVHWPVGRRRSMAVMENGFEYCSSQLGDTGRDDDESEEG